MLDEFTAISQSLKSLASLLKTLPELSRASSPPQSPDPVQSRLMEARNLLLMAQEQAMSARLEQAALIEKVAELKRS